MGLREPRVLFSNSQCEHTLVFLITHLFLIGLQSNLNQHFSYVAATYALPVK